jgi:hypothetical protein
MALLAGGLKVEIEAEVEVEVEVEVALHYPTIRFLRPGGYGKKFAEGAAIAGR